MLTQLSRPHQPYLAVEQSTQSDLYTKFHEIGLQMDTNQRENETTDNADAERGCHTYNIISTMQ